MTKYFHTEIRYANREYLEDWSWDIVSWTYDERSKTGDNTTLQDVIDDLEICVEDGRYSEYRKETVREVSKATFDRFSIPERSKLEKAQDKLIDFQENLQRLLDNVDRRIDNFNDEDIDAIESTRFNQMFQMIEHNQHID